MNTDDNPADSTSRGLSTSCEVKAREWFNGPDFLWKREEEWPDKVVPLEVAGNDLEVKKVATVNSTRIVCDVRVLTILETRMSS